MLFCEHIKKFTIFSRSNKNELIKISFLKYFFTPSSSSDHEINKRMLSDKSDIKINILEKYWKHFLISLIRKQFHWIIKIFYEIKFFLF